MAETSAAFFQDGYRVAADRLLTEAGLNSKEDPFYLVEEKGK